MSCSGDAYGFSDVGLVRSGNEDAFCVSPGALVVADGMGGHAGGEEASRLAVDNVKRRIAEHGLLGAVAEANAAVLTKGERTPGLRGMGTTIVAARAVAPSILEIVSVGDSRCYRIRRGRIEQLTRDDSLLNQYIDEGIPMTEAEKARVPSNIVTQALGLKPSLSMRLLKVPIENDDLFLLCSDGLHGMLSDDAILSCARGTPKVMVHRMIERANAAGGNDNVTVIAVRFSVS